MNEEIIVLNPNQEIEVDALIAYLEEIKLQFFSPVVKIDHTTSLVMLEPTNAEEN